MSTDNHIQITLSLLGLLLEIMAFYLVKKYRLDKEVIPLIVHHS